MNNYIIWFLVGFLSWLFLFVFDEGKEEKTKLEIFKELFWNVLFGYVTAVFVILALVFSKELRKLIIKKIKKN